MPGATSPPTRTPPEASREDEEDDGFSTTLDALFAASRWLVALAARSLVELDPAITLAQYRVLVLLSQSPTLTVAGIARELGVSPSTATRMCDRLVRKRLVSRTLSSTDRRRVEVALTVAGHALVETVAERRRRELAAALRPLPAAERARLAAALSALLSAAGATDPQRLPAAAERPAR